MAFGWVSVHSSWRWQKATNAGYAHPIVLRAAKQRVKRWLEKLAENTVAINRHSKCITNKCRKYILALDSIRQSGLYMWLQEHFCGGCEKNKYRKPSRVDIVTHTHSHIGVERLAFAHMSEFRPWHVTIFSYLAQLLICARVFTHFDNWNSNKILYCRWNWR